MVILCLPADPTTLREKTMNTDFIYDIPQSRVIFGAGSIQFLQREIELLGAKKL